MSRIDVKSFGFMTMWVGSTKPVVLTRVIPLSKASVSGSLEARA